MSFCFTNTRPGVQSYRDFFRMVELSGFDLINDGTSASFDVSVRTMYSVECRVKSKVSVLWYLERPMIDGGMDVLRDKFAKRNGFDIVWVSDRKLYNDLSDLGNVQFVPVGCHAGLCSTSAYKNYDFCHLMHPNQRRENILKGIKWRAAPCTYDTDVKTVSVSQSRFMVNVHQFEDAHIEPLRVALAVSAGLPVVSETCVDSFPYTGSGFFEVPYSSLVHYINELFAEPYEQYRVQGLELRKRVLTSYSFDHNVREAIETIGGKS